MSFTPKVVTNTAAPGNEPSPVAGAPLDANTASTLTNKEIDSASNTLKIDGTTVTGSTGSGGVLAFATGPTLLQPDIRQARVSITFASSPYTPNTANEVILVDASGGNVIVNLPTAVGADGNTFKVKKTDSSTNTITIDPNGAQTIDGSATAVFNNPQTTLEVISDNANWHII